MADSVVATHTATQTHDWLCAHCQASGLVTVSAKGESEAAESWFSAESASEVAHRDAAIELGRDASRICALVRCPSCGRRAPNAALATLWHGLFDLWKAICAGVAVFFVALALTSTEWMWMWFLTAGVAFVVTLAFGDERRRWREAAAAHVQLSNLRPSRRPHTASPILPTVAQPDPFRSPPSPPPIITERPPLPTHTPIVKSDSSDEPTLLR